MILTFDTQQRRINHKRPTLIPNRVNPSPWNLIIRPWQLQLPVQSQPSAKLHIVDLIDGSACLLHLLDSFERLVILPRELAGEEVEYSYLAVGE
jgi:hypothetical protein